MLASAFFVALAASVSTVSAQVAIANAQANAIAIAGAGAAAVTTPVVTVPAVTTTPAPIVNTTIPSGCFPTIPCTSTVTAASTSTFCPVCDLAKSNNAVYTTVFCTTLLAICPTGFTSSVYTITATATGTTPIPVVPTGFTTTVVCPGCPGSPTVVVTTPVAGTTVATANVAVFTGAASPNYKAVGAVAGSFGSVFAAMLLL